MKSSNRIMLGIAFCLATMMGACDKDDDSSNAPVISSTAKVVATSPIDAASAVAINRKIAVTFSQDMDATSFTDKSFKVAGPDAVSLAGTLSYEQESKTAVFTPSAAFAISTLYTVTITTAVKDKGAYALASEYSWTFTSGSTADATAPTVNSTIPANAAIGVAINTKIHLSFDKEMDPTTLSAATFSLSGPASSAILGKVTYTATTLTFTPSSNLATDTEFTATLTKAVKDLAGNSLASDFTLSFKTGTVAALGPQPLVLGTAGDYVILAKAAVSTTGVTAVVGNIGLSPAAQSFLTGFSETLDATNQFASSSVVVGKLKAADMAVPTPSKLTTAISNMEAAYTDAAGRTLPDFTELGAGDVSGKTLAPGLYKWGTGLLMSSDVTISGSAQDVWIFQIAQDLTVSNGVHVTLAGGALPKNIFWQVAGQVKLGTTSKFSGNILSQTQIVLQTGATLDGRALAQTAVTLDANVVTQP